MRRLINLVLALIFILSVAVYGQFRTQTKPVDIASTLRNPIGIGRQAFSMIGLDPERLHISQSYQMSYMSMGGQGYTQGVYLNTLSYQFSIPMSLSFQWGIAHQPNFGGNDAPFLQNGPFISGAQLRYQPKKNLLIQIDYHQVPYGTYDSYWMRRRYRMGRW